MRKIVFNSKMLLFTLMLLRIQTSIFKMLMLLGPCVNKFILPYFFLCVRQKKRKKWLVADNGTAATEDLSLKGSMLAVNPEQGTHIRIRPVEKR